MNRTFKHYKTNKFLSNIFQNSESFNKIFPYASDHMYAADVNVGSPIELPIEPKDVYLQEERKPRSQAGCLAGVTTCTGLLFGCFTDAILPGIGKSKFQLCMTISDIRESDHRCYTTRNWIV